MLPSEAEYDTVRAAATLRTVTADAGLLYSTVTHTGRDRARRPRFSTRKAGCLAGRTEFSRINNSERRARTARALWSS